VKDFEGVRAVVTGGASGIGLATAQLLVNRGATVACLDVNPSVTAPLIGIRADVSNDEVADSVADAATALGGIDVLVNNAGGARMGALKDLDEAAWQAAFELNFFSAVRLARLCAPLIERRGGGSIVNISSIYGREAGGPLTYNASKAAMISFTKMLSRELAPKGIRVNTVAPGSIFYPGGNWEKAFKANPAFEKDFLSHEFPAGRLGRPEEVAYAVVCLASPRASWITGACLPVDGAQGRSLI
jgi:3-oxoacyl-[acyl-carrier protein] reductase